jgi:uncharacterized protein (DUF1330 family)
MVSNYIKEGILTAYLLAQNNVTDPAWLEDYIANVPTIFRKYGGEYLAVSKQVRQYEGGGEAPEQVAIFTFPSLDALTEFLECEEYRPYREARQAGAISTVIGFES